jgi:hypothetical protein
MYGMKLKIAVAVILVIQISAVLALAIQPAKAQEGNEYEYEYLHAMKYGHEDSENAIFRLVDHETGIVCYSQYQSISCVNK